jgi:hypothetical protein
LTAPAALLSSFLTAVAAATFFMVVPLLDDAGLQRHQLMDAGRAATDFRLTARGLGADGVRAALPPALDAVVDAPAATGEAVPAGVGLRGYGDVLHGGS